jgi:hypothetical protein
VECHPAQGKEKWHGHIAGEVEENVNENEDPRRHEVRANVSYEFELVDVAVLHNTTFTVALDNHAIF